MGVLLHHVSWYVRIDDGHTFNYCAFVTSLCGINSGIVWFNSLFTRRLRKLPLKH